MSTAVVFGSTGAVGGQILETLLSTDTNSTFSSILTISRRLPKAQSPKLTSIQESDTSKWGELISNNKLNSSSSSAAPSAVFNAVGTTRSEAGGLANQWKIDHDLCIENARAAKAAGVKVYVYISSAGTRGLLSSYVPYSKMKVGVEEAIRGMGFEQAVIVRPGMILQREVSKAPFFEKLLGNVHRISPALQDSMGQDQKIIGRAAVAAAQMALAGKAPAKFWILEQADVIKYGRDEWKEG